MEVNETLADAPEKINKDPHGDAWLVKIRMTAPGDVNELLSAAEYEAYIAAEK
jgi:glycine cleavage system H protein